MNSRRGCREIELRADLLKFLNINRNLLTLNGQLKKMIRFGNFRLDQMEVMGFFSQKIFILKSNQEIAKTGRCVKT